MIIGVNAPMGTSHQEQVQHRATFPFTCGKGTVLGTGGAWTMPECDDDARAAADFEDMLRRASRDARVTGAKVSLYQALAGRYALLCSALLFVVLAILSAPFSFRATETLQFVTAGLYLLAAAVFLALYFWVRRDPLVPLVVGLILFCCVLVTSGFFVGMDFWLLELVVLIALIDAIRAAVIHRRLLRRVATND